MDEFQELNNKKNHYKEPEICRIKLAIEEAVLAACRGKKTQTARIRYVCGIDNACVSRLS